MCFQFPARYFAPSLAHQKQEFVWWIHPSSNNNWILFYGLLTRHNINLDELRPFLKDRITYVTHVNKSRVWSTFCTSAHSALNGDLDLREITKATQKQPLPGCIIWETDKDYNQSQIFKSRGARQHI